MTAYTYPSRRRANASPQPAPLPTAPTAVPSLTSLTRFGIAATHQQVRDCWRLVHDCYQHKGLIDYNPYGLHTTRQAINPDTTVVYGQNHGRITCTLSVIPDSESRGLPLDEVYPQILANLRNQGRKLVEVGLLADMRQNVPRDLGQTFGTMHFGFYRALHSGADIIIGVHPRHADFYIRMMGLEVVGQMSTHPKVNNRPVVPLLLDMARFRMEPQPRLLRFMKNNPLEADIFESRFRFGHPHMASSNIRRFLAYRQDQEKIKRFNDTQIMPIRKAGTL